MRPFVWRNTRGPRIPIVARRVRTSGAERRCSREGEELIEGRGAHLFALRGVRIDGHVRSAGPIGTSGGRGRTTRRASFTLAGIPTVIIIGSSFSIMLLRG